MMSQMGKIFSLGNLEAVKALNNIDCPEFDTYQMLTGMKAKQDWDVLKSNLGAFKS
jgi:hypothetical protein